MHTLIRKSRLNALSPLMHEGRAVYTCGEEIRTVLTQKLGREAKTLFSEVLPDSETGLDREMKWYTSSAESPTPITEITPEERKSFLQHLETLIQDIEKVCEEMSAEDDEDAQKMAGVISLGLIIPDPSDILVENDIIVFSRWGFAQKNESMEFSHAKWHIHALKEGKYPANSGKSANIRVRVLDSQEKPAANIRLKAMYKDASVEGYTDHKGRLAFPRVPVPSTIRFTLFPPEQPPLQEITRYEEADREQVIRLPFPVESRSIIRFQVLDSESRPLAKIPVQLVIGENRAADKTDEEGISEFSNIPVGTSVELHVFHGGEKPVTREFTAASKLRTHRVYVEKRRAIRKKRIWIPAFVIFLLAAVFLYVYLFRQSPLPDKPLLEAKIKGKVIQAPQDPLKRLILSDQLFLLVDPDYSPGKAAQEIRKRHPLGDIHIIGYSNEIGLLQITFPTGEIHQWKKAFEKIPGIAHAVYNTVRKPAYIPEDPGFHEDNAEMHSAFQAVGAFSGWEITKGDPDVTIAVIDSGFDIFHPEIKGKIRHSYNVITKNSRLSGKPGIIRHGTAVAAMAAGYVDNGKGAGGICPLCSLVLIQAGDEAGRMTDAGIIAGILFAVQKDVSVVNISAAQVYPEEITDQLAHMPLNRKKSLFAGNSKWIKDSQLLWKRVYLFLKKKNILMVASAGNEDMDAGTDPMKGTNTGLNVGAVDKKNRKAPFSNYGEDVHICAPGVRIYSASYEKGYAFSKGTSIAAPFVSGAAGLIRSVRPDTDAGIIRQILLATAIPLASAYAEKPIGPLLALDRALFKLTGKPPKAGGNKGNNCEKEIERLWKEIHTLKQEIRRMKMEQNQNE